MPDQIPRPFEHRASHCFHGGPGGRMSVLEFRIRQSRPIHRCPDDGASLIHLCPFTGCRRLAPPGPPIKQDSSLGTERRVDRGHEGKTVRKLACQAPGHCFDTWSHPQRQTTRPMRPDLVLNECAPPATQCAGRSGERKRRQQRPARGIEDDQVIGRHTAIGPPRSATESPVPGTARAPRPAFRAQELPHRRRSARPGARCLPLLRSRSRPRISRR